MRAPVLLILTVLSLGAAACATTTDAPPSSPAASSGSPAPVEGYDWFFHEDQGADTARLAYGLEASDDLRLGLDCVRASGRLELSANGDEGAKPEIYIESGGDTERFPAKSEPSQLHDGIFLTAQAAADEPVFLRFRRLGWLALWQGEERQTYVAHPQSLAGVERFFAFCG